MPDVEATAPRRRLAHALGGSSRNGRCRHDTSCHDPCFRPALRNTPTAVNPSASWIETLPSLGNVMPAYAVQ
jgi:hypothetical protein